MRDGEAELAAAGFAADRRRFAASLDMRYLGQSFELSVPVALDVGEHRAMIERAFSEVYAARYGAAADARDRDRQLSPRGLGPVGQADAAADRARPDARSTADDWQPRVIFDGAAQQTSVFDRDRCRPASRYRARR